jgi:rare lipoprotein A
LLPSPANVCTIYLNSQRPGSHQRQAIPTDVPSSYGVKLTPYLLTFTLIAFVVVVSGCASRRPVAAAPPPPASTPEPPPESVKAPPTPPAPKRRKDSSAPVESGYTEEGEASWYGAQFHGRQASNGEIYDMNKMTAAHRTLPFETMVRVTNQRNGKSAVVRITDRGPFVNNRIIDLSYAAAKAIESIGQGVVPVRLEVVSTGIDPEAGFFTIQVGAFRDQANAERLRDRLSPSYSPVSIQRFAVADGAYYRVHVGKISGLEAAKEMGEQLRSREGFVPMVIRLDQGTSDAKESR